MPNNIRDTTYWLLRVLRLASRVLEIVHPSPKPKTARVVCHPHASDGPRTSRTYKATRYRPAKPAAGRLPYIF